MERSLFFFSVLFALAVMITYPVLSITIVGTLATGSPPAGVTKFWLVTSNCLLGLAGAAWALQAAILRRWARTSWSPQRVPEKARWMQRKAGELSAFALALLIVASWRNAPTWPFASSFLTAIVLWLSFATLIRAPTHRHPRS